MFIALLFSKAYEDQAFFSSGGTRSTDYLSLLGEVQLIFLVILLYGPENLTCFISITSDELIINDIGTLETEIKNVFNSFIQYKLKINTVKIMQFRFLKKPFFC